MRVKKTLAGILCASIIGFNASSISADPVPNPTKVSLIRGTKQKIDYDFSEFFGFQYQDSIEDLISYTYSKYNRVVKSVKSSYPGITLEEIIRDSSFWDKLRFGWLLYFDYRGNLNNLGYKIENIGKDVEIKGDNLKLFILDEKKLRKGDKLPCLQMIIDVSSLPESMNVNEIKIFLNGDKSYLLETTENGKFFYSIQRYAKPN